jgi:hypothetical protein
MSAEFQEQVENVVGVVALGALEAEDLQQPPPPSFPRQQPLPLRKQPPPPPPSFLPPPSLRQDKTAIAFLLT